MRSIYKVEHTIKEDISSLKCNSTGTLPGACFIT